MLNYTVVDVTVQDSKRLLFKIFFIKNIIF